uniref:Uncharacterized protein n=1 Tax=Arundo donax TaxID=35708 RepID=A0A0A9BNM7_ARUDO
MAHTTWLIKRKHGGQQIQRAQPTTIYRGKHKLAYYHHHINDNTSRR